MKYLRKFNEGNEYVSEIKDFSNNYLSYLLDEGFIVKVKEEFGSYLITISTDPSIYTNPNFLNFDIRRYGVKNIPHPKSFEWSDVSDYLIPFLIKLKENYIVRTQIFFHTIWTHKYVTYNRVLNDNYVKPTEISNIIIKIKKDK